jgi:hypothetical protein
MIHALKIYEYVPGLLQPHDFTMTLLFVYCYFNNRLLQSCGLRNDGLMRELRHLLTFDRLGTKREHSKQNYVRRNCAFYTPDQIAFGATALFALLTGLRSAQLRFLHSRQDCVRRYAPRNDVLLAVFLPCLSQSEV